MYKQTLPLSNFLIQSEISDYQCFLCKGIINIPVIDSCGHTFCNSCYHQYLTSSNLCPISSQLLPSNPMRLPLIESIINSYELNCINNPLGCDWQGKVIDLHSHLNDICLKQTMTCPFNGCGLQFQREFLNEHVYTCDYREAKCINCLLTMPFILIRDHDAICLKKLLDCPLQCGMRIIREEVKMHTEGNCDNKPMKCPYAHIGCVNDFTLKTLGIHLNTQQDYHCDLFFEYYQKCKRDQDDYVNRLNEYVTQIEKENEANELLALARSKLLMKEMVTVIGIKGIKRSKKKKKKRNNSGDNNNNNRPLFKIEKSKKGNISLYDIKNMPNEIEVNGSVVKCNNTNRTEHKYVFINMPIPLLMPTSNTQRTEIKWSVNLQSDSNWIGFGLGLKSKILSNKMMFYSSAVGFNHYSFIISSNGFLWNSNLKSEDNVRGSFDTIKKGDVVYFSYYPQTQELYFKIKDYISKLNQVYSVIENEELTPCIVILNCGDLVSVDLY